MRVNPNIYGDIVQAVNGAQSREQTALQQVSTGLRVNQPSDDPAAFGAWTQNTAAQSQAAQYQQNISSVQSLLQTADSALGTVVTSLTQAITLGVEGGTGTSNSQNQQSIAAAVSGIQNQIISLANTSFQGTFVFAGTANNAPPFALNSSTGVVTYSGSSNTNSVQIGDGLSTAVNVPGDQIFTNPNGNVMQSLTQLVQALQSGSTSAIQTATAAVRSALDQVSQQKVFYGNTENALQSQDSFLSTEVVSLKSNENALVGADVTQSATDLSAAQTALSATYAAAGRILPMSILNYLQ
jgi:flagellar hook-associated protein 3 FlgL